MKTMQMHYNMENDILAQKIETYIKDICTSDQAMAEPCSDSELPWWAIGLIITVCEAFWANRQDPDFVIMGLACPKDNMMRVDTQDYLMPDPLAALKMQVDLHNTTDFIAVYIAV
jgi:hypothetical protein